ncbi:MAG: polysaccharide deacetylase family protein [Oscillospiraceae bacterium]|nr:polysaccharide deacetylase family protein [Oscillospiraceae bacterium]
MSQKKYAVFTMDVESFGDTECLSSAGIQVDADLTDGFDEYLKILDKYGIKSTLFVVGDLAPRIADRLRPHIAKGHCLALHSYSHIAPMTVSVEQFKENTRRAKEQFRELFDIDVVGFRAPCFSMDRERLSVLQELGFQYDSSDLGYEPARHTVKLDLDSFRKLRKGVFREGGFYEFGLPTEKIFASPYPIAGGGYVRLSNWGFIKTLIRHYIHKNDYYVFYLHPFELTKQKVPFIKQLKSYDKYYLKKGIGKYGWRVEQIIKMLQKSGYEFVTFEQLVQIMNKEQ